VFYDEEWKEIDDPSLASAESSLSGKRVNRFLHIAENATDLVNQNKMQRKLGQLTGTCFQRCVGMDALNSLYSTTFEIDEKYHTTYHQRLKEFIKKIQEENHVIGGAMTDVKGDRSLSPSQQEDPDLFVHITKRDEKGVYITGAKAHQTGCINSHWILVMPTMRLREEDKNYAIVGAVPADAEGMDRKALSHAARRRDARLGSVRHARGSGGPLRRRPARGAGGQVPRLEGRQRVQGQARRDAEEIEIHHERHETGISRHETHESQNDLFFVFVVPF